jgi:hypothetical protein
MADYTCKHCGANLDEGDILEHVLLEYGDQAKARETAARYGWTETNKLHFNRSTIIQPDIYLQYTVCPDCNQKYPLPQKK